MSFERGGYGKRETSSPEARADRSVGKRTLTESLPVQRRAEEQGEPAPARAAGPPSTEHIHAAAAAGTSGTGGALPHMDRIQSLFGRHDISHIKAHTGGDAASAARSMGAEAFAVGEHVAFRDAPSLHTAAHEAAHVVQQQAGVHLAGGVGAAGDAYERHADQVADLVVQGKSAEHLLDQTAGGGAASAVQRKVDSHFGEWYDDDYKVTTTGTRNSVKMDLRFHPKPMVDAELIGLTQTVRSVKNKAAYFINNNATTKKHSISSGDAKTVDAATGETDEGAHIDQADYNRNPLYAAEGAPDTDTKLDQTLPDPDVTKKNDWGRHGFRYDSGGASKEQDALLFDKTGLNDSAKDSAQIFETTAVAIKGNQQDTYYGSVEWGWRSDGAGKVTTLPLKVVSEGVPSATFMKSAQIWNAEKTSGGKDTLDLPTVEVKVTSAQIIQKLPAGFIGPPLAIPKGTRVKVITAPSAGKNGTIQVVDGVFVGQRLDIDATDQANLAAERT
jgi:hypothetical protein